MEPDHAFTLEELLPYFIAYGETYGVDPRVLAAVAAQESTFHNYRVHRDGKGHGLFGITDGGQMPGFERFTGQTYGAGATADILPPEQQIAYTAEVLGRLARTKYDGDVYSAVQEWHRGWKNWDDERGREYRRLVQGHVARLFG